MEPITTNLKGEVSEGHGSLSLHRNLLVEDGNAGERSGSPFGGVLLELWVYRLEKGAHEWNLHWRTDNVALAHDIHDWKSLAITIYSFNRIKTYSDRRQQVP